MQINSFQPTKASAGAGGHSAPFSALPVNAFCISSLKTAPVRGREEVGLQPALTQLCRLWLGWLWTSSRTSIPGAGTSHPALQVRVSLHGEKLLLGRCGGTALGVLGCW